MTTSQLPTVPRSARDEEELVTANLPLVGYLVAEMIGRVPAHVSRDDLMSAGLAALAYAARGFDGSRGVPFGRFASTRIRGALIDELRSHDWASRSVRSKARARDAAVEQLAVTLGRTPTPGEVAEHLGVAPSEVASMDDDIQRAVVLSLQGFADPSAIDELAPAGDISPDERLLANERIGYLHDAIAVLPDRLRVVVTRYFFQERPMAEIAVELGVTESRVSQMRSEALLLIREGITTHLDRDESAAPAPAGVTARRRESYVAAVAARSDFRTRLAARPIDVAPLFTRTA